MPDKFTDTITKRVQKFLDRIKNLIVNEHPKHKNLPAKHAPLQSRNAKTLSHPHSTNTSGKVYSTNSIVTNQDLADKKHLSQNSQHVRRERLSLPFMKRKEDAGVWVYRHRTALSITLICYLLLAIVFVSSKIVLSRHDAVSTIIVDFSDLEQLQEELEKAQELNKLLREQQQYENISNRISNEYGQETEEMFSRNGSMSDIYNQAQQVQGRVKANRERFEQGLREEQQMIDAQKNQSGSSEKTPATTNKAIGKVTVSYALNNPLRNAEYLYIPAYRCEGGGEVVVNITVSRNGDVTEAEVDTALSSSDYCMTTTAIEAAMRSRFDVNLSAPAKQYGTISYVFIPQ